MEKAIKIVGHRGVAALRPENTLVSFKYAIELGLDGIETDIHMSADGELVLIHDDTLERTSNGNGSVCDFTLKELKELDVGSWFSEEYAHQRIPTFREFLELVNGKELFLNVEIKDPREIVIEKTLALLREYHIQKENFVIASFHSDVTKYVIEKHGLNTQGFPLSYYEKRKKKKPESYEGFYSIGIGTGDLTKEFCDTLKRQKIQPWCWCPDTKEQIEYAILCGSPLVTVNNPLPALEILRKEG